MLYVYTLTLVVVPDLLGERQSAGYVTKCTHLRWYPLSEKRGGALVMELCVHIDAGT